MINYYEILNVPPRASLKEINKAYKRESIKWHPDKNSSSEAKGRMVLINEARLILSDSEARAKYDIELELYTRFNNSSGQSKEKAYVFSDVILYKWMSNARQQAQELAKASLDDLIGISKAGVSAFYQETKYAIAIYIALILFVVFLS